MSRIYRVAITGPECTGKSTLTEQLAGYFHTKYVPEYAREYIAGLNRPYTFEDVLHIAEVQRDQANSAKQGVNGIIFFDTWLIITKVWFQVVYGHFPTWIDDEIQRKTMDLYLLCDTGIPWIADEVRENGGEMREMLFQKYLDELENQKCNFVIIHGTGQQRLTHAIEAINQFFPDICSYL